MAARILDLARDRDAEYVNINFTKTQPVRLPFLSLPRQKRALEPTWLLSNVLSGKRACRTRSAACDDYDTLATGIASFGT